MARYVELAERALGEGSSDQAERYLGRAEGILPEAEILTKAHERLVEARKTEDEDREQLAGLEREREAQSQKQLAQEAQRAAAPERQRQEQAAKSKPGAVFRDTLQNGSQGPAMVVIPRGSFTMGSPANESWRYGNEGPQHKVTITKQFAIGRYEVTFAEYDRFARATGRKLPGASFMGRGTRPVINVTWGNAVAYTEWLSEQTGESYRLPSEAEWEYVARAGTTTPYWWGKRIGSNHANCNFCGGRYTKTIPVGSLAPNPFGLYETSGNVWEWTLDCWNGSYDGAPSDGSAWLSGGCSAGPEFFHQRVIRGGSWITFARKVRSANRDHFSASLGNNDIGFRIARDL